jgi:transposase
VLFEDETDLLLFPPLRAAWSRRGQPAPVPISGANAKRVIFGALNVHTGSRLFLDQPRQRAENFRAFLDLVHWHYRGWRVAMVLDEDSSHTAGGSTALAARLGIDLLWLPKRTPHLNPMDHLWRHAKAVVCANRQYRSIDDQVEDFLVYLYGLTATEALTKAGVLSGNFWLDR